MEELKIIIDNNEYIKSCKSNKKKDFNSLSYLIDITLSQSDSIKLGIAMEKLLVDIIINKNSNLENIKLHNNIKGISEKDHLFKNELKKEIYYAEIKSNLNLDTEKSKATSVKCLKILDELKAEYKDYNVKMYLVGIRYISKTQISKVINNKYTIIKNNLVGINEYFNELNIDYNFSNEDNYKIFLNYVVNKMLSN